MKQLKLLLFVCLVSLAACKKESAEPAISNPTPTGEYWKSSLMTIDPKIPDQKFHLCKVNMYITSTYFVRDFVYESGYLQHDSTACTISGDSIYYEKYGIDYAGKHEIINDTLRTIIPPYKYYK